MKIKQSPGSLVFDIANYTFMVLLMIITIYPFLNVLAVSISDSDSVSRGLVNIIPKGINFDMYRMLLWSPEVRVSYLNTVEYALVNLFITLVLNSIMAYALSKPDLPGRSFLTIFLAVTMFFSGGLIPTFLIIKQLGGINTFWVMVLPFTVSAWTVIVMRTFFQSLPYSLTESAVIDGAGETTILTQIILPLSKPLYATMSLFCVVGKWNSWFDAFIYLTNRMKYPIQTMLREVSILGNILNNSTANDMIRQGQQAALIIPQSYKAAMMMIVIIPIIILYPFFQRYFIKGVMIGAIKG